MNFMFGETNDVDAAMIRCKQSMRRLSEGVGRGMMLDTTAAMIVEADYLLSALSLIYDGLYRAERSTGVINRRPSQSFPPKRRSKKRPARPEKV